MFNPFNRKPSAETETRQLIVLDSGELIKPNEYRSHVENRVQSIISSGRSADDSVLASVVARSVPAMVCVNFHSTVTSSIPIVANETGGGLAPFVPMKYMLDNRMRWLINDLDKSLSIWGYAMARKHYNSNKYPFVLTFLNPLNVRINTDAKQNILDYRLNREQENLALNEVIYISGFDYNNTGDPVSKLENALAYTGLERGIVNHANSFFFNGASIAGILSIEGAGMTAEKMNEAENRFKKRFAGAKNAFKIAIIEANVTYTPLSVAPTDLAMVELSDQSKQFVCAAFGVNPALVGLGDVSDPLSASSTYDATKRSFIDAEATPALDFILDNLNTQWALTDFSTPIMLVSDSSAMAMMNDGISSDDMSVAVSAGDGGFWTFDEQREHLGYKPLALDDGYITRNPAFPNVLYDNGTISLNQKRKMLGIETMANPDLIKIDGITYRLTDMEMVASNNLKKLEAPAPSPFALSIQQPQAYDLGGVALLDAPLIAQRSLPYPATVDNSSHEEVVIIEGIARQVQPRLVIGVDLANHQLLNLARRELGRALEDESGIVWVEPENWRVELAHIDRWSPADIANMTRVIKWDFNRTEVWTGDYFTDGDGVYLRVTDTEVTDDMRRLVHSDLRSIAIKSNEPTPIMAVRLASGDIGDVELPTDSGLGSMPIVFTRIAAFANNKVQHRWKLRAYYDDDNKELRRNQRDELTKWQQRVARSGLGSEWNIDCLPAHIVRFIRGDDVEELRLALAKFIEEDHPRDPDGKFGSGDGGDSSGDSSDKDDDKKKEGEEDKKALNPQSDEAIKLPKEEKIANAELWNKQQDVRDRVREQSSPPPTDFDRDEESLWVDSLSKDEAVAMRAWSSNSYNSIQARDRGEPSMVTNTTYEAFVKAVDDAPNYEGTTWRGISVKDADPAVILESYQDNVGGSIEFDVHSSASASVAIGGGFAGVSQEVNTPVMFEIHSNKGKYTNSTSLHGGGNPEVAGTPEDEYEVIFQPGSSFAIQDAHMGNYKDLNGIEREAVFVILEDA